jgi:hypothetical protein
MSHVCISYFKVKIGISEYSSTQISLFQRFNHEHSIVKNRERLILFIGKGRYARGNNDDQIRSLAAITLSNMIDNIKTATGKQPICSLKFNKLLKFNPDKNLRDFF